MTTRTDLDDDTPVAGDTTLYDLHIAAARLAVSTDTLRRMARAGAIGSVRVGPKRAYRFTPTHLADYIAENSRPAHA